MTSSSGVVSKSEFARMIGVSKARVSQLISEGKISGEALRGDGRSAKIVVAVATAQLKATLDIDQRAANGRADLSSDEPVFDDLSSGESDTAQRPLSTDDLYKQERLRKLQDENEERLEKRREKRGIYVRSDAMRSTVLRHVGAMIDGIEADLGQWAEELAAETDGSIKKIKHILRTQFRETRTKLARHNRELQNELPEYHEEAIGSEDDAGAS
ncbi:hypothetical protein [Thalassospira marina]|nr:hypothetical protein [Thalassospira marina]